MRVRLHGILLAAALAWQPVVWCQAQTDDAMAARIDAAIGRDYRVADPGATVIVTQGGRTVYRKAFGRASVARDRAMKPEHVLRLGSITKQFTAVAILMLVDQRRMALDADIRNYLPDFPDKGQVITIEHLLTHTSGIPNYSHGAVFDAGSDQERSVAQVLEMFQHKPLLFAPGTRFSYSNSGYFLLGAIIERITGQRYGQFLEQNMFAPLGMLHTAVEGEDRAPGLRAAGHALVDGKFIPSAPISMSQTMGAGALISTVDDLARWDAAISRGRLLTQATWRRAFTPYVLADGRSTGYGYGWQIGSFAGVPMIHHGGGIPGYLAYTLRLPEQQLYVAVLTNAEAGIALPGVVAAKAAAAALGKLAPTPPPATSGSDHL